MAREIRMHPCTDCTPHVDFLALHINRFLVAMKGSTDVAARAQGMACPCSCRQATATHWGKALLVLSIWTLRPPLAHDSPQAPSCTQSGPQLLVHLEGPHPGEGMLTAGGSGGGAASKTLPKGLEDCSVRLRQLLTSCVVVALEAVGSVRIHVGAASVKHPLRALSP